MLDSLLRLVAFARAIVGGRVELTAEHLVLRQPLAVLTRPTRRRPRRRPLSSRGWALARRLRRDRRQSRLVVRPETVIRRHRRPVCRGRTALLPP